LRYVVIDKIAQDMESIGPDTILDPENEEHQRYFASLSYGERLRHFFKLRHATYVEGKIYPKGRIFKVYRSHDELR
jgi:hypothetical protein